MKPWLRRISTVVVCCLLAACAAPNTPISAPPTAPPSPTAPSAEATGAPSVTPLATTAATANAAATAASTRRAPKATRTPAGAATVAATSAPPSTQGPQTGGGNKPNIVFILTDDLDAAEIQYMPKLKALIADQGLTFSNYSVAMSLCCPSRSTTLRGQYPHNTQILGNSLPTGGFEKFFQLGEEKSTIAVWLQAAGYHTMLAGKYLNGYPLKSDPTYIPPGWNEWYSAMKGNAYGEFNYTLNENGKPVAYGSQPQDYGTDVYVGKALDFISRSMAAQQPFFVYLAPYAPHAPYTPAPRHADLFPGAMAPRTPNYNEADVSDKPAYIRDRPLLTQKLMDLIDKDYRMRLQALQAVDEGVAAIVDKLQAAGQLDNTYIFFTSDNGYHLGNHRQLVGKIAPYQEELRVTMLVRGPGVPAGQSLDYLAGNVDLAPTWADLAGAQAPDFVDGRSLAPLMRANPPALAQWRQVFGIENGPDKVDASTSAPTPPPNTDPGLLEPADQDELAAAALPAAKKNNETVPFLRGLRTQTLSYVEYVTGERELYNLESDPQELTNMAAAADPNLLAALSARVHLLANCQGAGCHAAEDAPLNLP